MTNPVFRYGSFGRYSFSTLLILYSLFLFVQSLHLLQQEEGRFSGLVIFQLVLCSLFLLYTVGSIIYRLSLRVFLSENSMIFQAYHHWGWRLMYMVDRQKFIGEVPYQKIKSIENYGGMVESGMLRINFQENISPVVLDIRYIENNVDFMNILTSHLSQEQLDTKEKLDILSKPYPYIKFRLITIIIGFFLGTAVYTSLVIKDFYKSNVWNQEVLGPPAYQASIDSDGSLWAVSMWNKPETKVLRISENTIEEWYFPQELCTGDCSFLLASRTVKGLPRIIDFNKVVYSWDGNQWVIEDTLSEDFSNSFQSYDNIVWGIKNDHLTYVNFDTDEIKEFSSPPEVESLGLKVKSFKFDIDGSILALFSDKSKPELLYRLKDDRWQLLLNNSEERINTTFAVDPQGNVWALRWSYYSDAPTYALGYFDERLQVWKWQYVPSLYTDHTYINDIAIDQSRRVWISGNYGGDDFMQVVSWSENGLSLIEEYDEENSDLRMTDNLIVTKSGKLWSTPGYLYWLDTTADLPKPLPDWVIEAETLLSQYGGWAILIFAIVVVSSLILETRNNPIKKE